MVETPMAKPMQSPLVKRSFNNTDLRISRKKSNFNKTTKGLLLKNLVKDSTINSSVRPKSKEAKFLKPKQVAIKRPESLKPRESADFNVKVIASF